MQVFAVFQRVLLTALAVSAAKLPLPSSVGPTQELIGAPGSSGAFVVPVPSQLSTLYEAPLADLPAPAQLDIVIQTPTELPPVPAELSILYEAPVEDIPSDAQPSILVQNPVETVLVPENSPSPTQHAVFIQTSGNIVPVPSEPSSLYELPVKNLPPAQQSAVNIVPVSAEPSTLYEIPFETLSATTQQLNEPAILHDVPFENLPAPAQQPSLIQSPLNIIPVPAEPATLDDLPSDKLPAPAQQPSSVQSPFNIVPVPAEPATLYELPSDNLPALAQQPSSVQSPFNIVPVPAEPATLYELPSDNLPAPAQQPSSVQSPLNIVPVPVEPSPLDDVPAEHLPVPTQQFDVVQTPSQIVPVSAEFLSLFEVPVEDISTITQQSSLIQTPTQIVPVPVEPSTIYNVPGDSLPVSSQATFLNQTPVEEQQEQEVPFGHIHTSINDPAVSVVADPSVLYDTPAVPIVAPNEPSTSYGIPEETIQAGAQFPTIIEISQVAAVPEIPEATNIYEPPNAAASFAVDPSFVPAIQDQSILSAPFDTPAEVPAQPSVLYETSGASFPVPAVPSTLSQNPSEIILVSDEPTVLYDTPSGSFPITDTLSSVHSVIQPVFKEPAELYETPNNPILFPEQAFIQKPTVTELVLVPAVPSTLYGIPEEQSSFQSSQFGPPAELHGKSMTSSPYEVPAAANSPVASIAKGSMMNGMMPYNFEWGVEDNQSGNAFTHFEKSDGQSTSGQYRVTLPDGRIQVVNFYDNGNGFHAHVTYE